MLTIFKAATLHILTLSHCSNINHISTRPEKAPLWRRIIENDFCHLRSKKKTNLCSCPTHLKLCNPFLFFKSGISEIELQVFLNVWFCC